MSLIGTLGKVALGIAVAKGVGKVSGGAGSALGGLLGGKGAGQGGLGALGALLGGGGGAQSGGLGGLLDSLGGGAAGGGLGALLNSALQGGQSAQQPNQHQEETAKVLIQALVNAAKSDGQIDQTEQQKIVANLGDEVSEQERQFVVNEMQAPLDFDNFVRSIPSGAGEQVYLMSLMGIDLDTQAEAKYLDKLRGSLGISQQASNAIHQQLGVPALYA